MAGSSATCIEGQTLRNSAVLMKAYSCGACSGGWKSKLGTSGTELADVLK